MTWDAGYRLKCPSYPEEDGVLTITYTVRKIADDEPRRPLLDLKCLYCKETHAVPLVVAATELAEDWDENWNEGGRRW